MGILLLLLGQVAIADPGAAQPALEPAPLEGTIDPARYLLGPGDQLRIDLWGLRSSTEVVEVNAEGELLLPELGALTAGGRLLGKVQRALIRRLHEAYPRLKASVTLTRPRTFLVHVTGAVAHPGTYRATPLDRVSALIPRAGGVLPAGSRRRVEVRRAARTLIADLVRFSLFGEAADDPFMLDGDTVFVPMRQVTVQITGAVRRPGSYELIGAHDLRELINLAGGASTEAARGLPYRLTERGAGNHLQVQSIDPAHDVTLSDGEVVHVPALADLRQTVIVEGAVIGPAGWTPAEAAEAAHTEPGGHLREVSVPLPFVAGDGVRDLLVKAGGLQPWADGASAYLLRPVASGQRRRIAVDIPAILRGLAPEVEAVAGDTLMIPSRREEVLVGGAVQHPGLYQFRPELHPADYLSLAGGPTRTGQPDSARVLEPNGATKRLTAVTSIEPGAVITVPERHISTAEWVTITLILSNLAAATTAVVLSATLH